VSTPVRILERLALNAAFGVRFRDMADGSTVIDGLVVEVFPRGNPNARTTAVVNRSGIYVAHRVPGLRDFEFADVADPRDLWPAALAPFRIEVSDPQGRYLPIAFDADLPARGLFTWLAPWLSPPQPVALPLTAGSPPQFMLGHIPLFPAPARPVPDPLAVLYAQLRDQATGAQAAWFALGVSIDGVPRGLGLADAQGRVAVMFPYPEPPRASLASPPESRNDFTWEVGLAAYGVLASPPRTPSPFADLEQVLAALAAPRAVVESIVSPAVPLRLAYRVPIVARTAGAAGPAASFLLVS